MQELGVGIAGFGFIGKVHAHAYNSMGLFYDPPPPRTRLVGVCTSRPETAAKAAEQGGFAVATTDYRELIARDDIHIINVCTPNDVHRPIVLDALAAGKHVYCDKPLCLDLAEAREIAAVARSAAPRHQMTFHVRFVPAIMRAKQLIEAGFLGQLHHFHAAYLHAGYADPERPMSWRIDKARGGAGALADLGSHIIDLMRHLLGDFAAVNATAETFIRERPVAAGATERVPVEVDDYVCMRARMEGGGLGGVEASRFATGTDDELKFAIYGRRGALKFDLMQPNYLWAFDEGEPGGDFGGERGFKRIACGQQYPGPAALPSPKLPIGWIRFHIACLHSFLAHIADDTPCDPDLLQGAATQAIMHAAIESSDSGSWVDVPTI
ncbi:MAG: Gfo/Idh/MocA family oxidoreductase [Armatimonadota bacterium]|jgi:predicted dehydrogenase